MLRNYFDEGILAPHTNMFWFPLGIATSPLHADVGIILTASCRNAPYFSASCQHRPAAAQEVGLPACLHMSGSLTIHCICNKSQIHSQLPGHCRNILPSNGDAQLNEHVLFRPGSEERPHQGLVLSWISWRDFEHSPFPTLQVVLQQRI